MRGRALRSPREYFLPVRGVSFGFRMCCGNNRGYWVSPGGLTVSEGAI